MSPASRQDVQNITEAMRSRLVQSLPTKQDIIILNDTIRNLMSFNQQTMQMLKQADYQRSQQSRRVVALEARLANVETELRNVQAILARVAEQKPQQVIMPVQTEQPVNGNAAGTQYLYRPS